MCRGLGRYLMLSTIRKMLLFFIYVYNVSRNMILHVTEVGALVSIALLE
jgi:hypothetical protein